MKKARHNTVTCLPGHRVEGCTSPGVHVHIIHEVYDDEPKEEPCEKATDDTE